MKQTTGETMIIEIKSISGRVLYSSEATNLRECLQNAIKDAANLQWAKLQGAYLQGADLQGANLQGADLQGAYLQGAKLQGAYLQGAKLQDGIKIEKTPIQIDALTYFIFIFDSHMKIGCEFHAISEWWGFTDEQIANMDRPRATEFWSRWKGPLQAICAAKGRS